MAAKKPIDASKEDGYAYASSRHLYEQFQGYKVWRDYEGAGHGTNMLEGTDLDEALIAFLSGKD
ncbi:hypothetical protein KJ765_02950 [Candidatus Micrarchaeota archaeon]|nr:hypothetical protein [Candidatus Micrarchaeota archaeon]